MPYPEAVLFDNDGLLLDTESVWTRAEQELFRRRGLEFTMEHKRRLLGSSQESAGRKLGIFFEEAGQEGAIMEELNFLVLEELERGVDEMPGAAILVNHLRRAGVPVGLVSNSPRRFIERSHEVAGTGLEFDVIVSGHEVRQAKPAPDAYLEGCSRLGASPGKRVIALEDSPSGVTSACAAGLFVIGVPSVPGIELKGTDLAAGSLEDQPVRAALGIRQPV